MFASLNYSTFDSVKLTPTQYSLIEFHLDVDDVEFLQRLFFFGSSHFFLRGLCSDSPLCNCTIGTSPYFALRHKWVGEATVRRPFDALEQVLSNRSCVRESYEYAPRVGCGVHNVDTEQKLSKQKPRKPQRTPSQ